MEKQLNLLQNGARSGAQKKAVVKRVRSPPKAVR